MKYTLLQSQFNKQVFVLLSVKPFEQDGKQTELYELENVRTGDVVLRTKERVDEAFDILPDEVTAKFAASLKLEKWKII